MNINRNDIEIMSPVGSLESLIAAMQSKTNSIYFGIGNLNMRSASTVNFNLNDLQKISNMCKEHNIKSYLTLNTIIYDNDINAMKDIISAAIENNIDSIIASDFAVIEESIRQGINIHCSTQLNISNKYAVKYFSQFADVIVLARELNLEQVTDIHNFITKNNIKGPSGNLIRIEMFIHGALCMAISGKCYLSLHHYNKSANRGTCLQDCRREYDVYVATEKEEKHQLNIENKNIMSPKDLCTLPFLDKILNAGARVLKIEGRGRSPEYVRRVVETYNIALEHIINDSYTDDVISKLVDRVGEVFNRGFWGGYYLGKTMGEWAEKHSSSATKQKEFIGIGTNYFSRLGVGEFLIQTGEIKVGDEVIIIGPTTGVLELTIIELHNDNGITAIATKGERFAIAVPEKIRKNDKIYKLRTNTN
jgi:putative protease